jgi:hypothetical protein
MIILEQHSALIKINQLLQAITDKNFSDFKLAFNLNEPFLDLLPGGVRIESALALIESHRAFFFDPYTAFQFSPLLDIIDAGSTISAASIVEVGLADGSTRQVYLRLLYQLNQQEQWWPRLLQNTLIDAEQKVIG